MAPPVLEGDLLNRRPHLHILFHRQSLL